jgi:hypothetical protein
VRFELNVVGKRETINEYIILVGKCEGNRPLGRPRRRWEVNIKMDLEETGLEDVDSIHLAQDRNRWRDFVNMAMKLTFP